MVKSVLVGMSGGIDSAMTAHMLQMDGYKVHGVHFNFYSSDADLIDERKKVEALAAKLKVDFSYYDARELFRKEVINYFTSFYSQGLTPSPCVHCNANAKLKLLSDLSNEWGYDYFATGHYIQLKHENNLVQVQKGVDSKKDQSYYLWQVSQDILKKFMTPLGAMNKEDIKTYAIENGFSELVKKKESTGLCFAQGRGVAEILNDYVPELVERIGEGPIVDRNGNIVGKHNGYIYYTLGQKSNMELTIDGKPAVVEINHKTNTLVVDHWQTLYVNEFKISDAVFYEPEKIEELTGITTKVRGLGLNPEGETQLVKFGENKYLVKLENPAWAPAPGQPAVFYQGDNVLGGGIINHL